jgi:hypothetical protein
MNCIKSITSLYNNIKIYVADQNNPSEEMISFYEKYNVEYYFTENNSGLSANRNFLVDKVKEPYIFIGDDDFVFTKETDLTIMQDVLNEDKSIGIVGGKLIGSSRYNKRLLYDKLNKKIYLIDLKEKFHTTKNKNKFIYTDLVLNFFLCKKEIFNDIRWDNNLKLSEHLDFFLRFKLTNWKVAYTADVVGLHERERTTNYMQFRHQSNIFYHLFLNKYSLNSLDDIINLTDNISTINILPAGDVNTELNPLPSNIIRQNLELTPPLRTIDTSKNNTTYNIMDFLNWLKENDISYCLLKESCFKYVIKKYLSTDILQIGIQNNKEKQKIINYINKNNLVIELYNYSLQNTKIYRVRDLEIHVPCPLKKYLENFTQKSWTEIEKEIENGI